MEPDTTSILKEINAKLDSIQRSTAVLADIVDRNIGIERIWPNRRAWANDPSSAGMEAWKKRACQAKEVDIVSNTLWSNWFQDLQFREEFFASMAGKTRARILIYDYLSDALQLRARDENGDLMGMQYEIRLTLKNIACHRDELPPAAKEKLQVHLTTWSYHLAQIVRADDHMLVATYLSGKSGSPSPTFQVKGPDTAYFRTYQGQIDILWNRGREVSDDEFHRIALRIQETSQQVDVARLRQLLADYFDENELRDLCFDLRIGYDSLTGEGKTAKARELVAYCDRHGSIPDLVEKCYELRPKAPWRDVLPRN